MATGNLATTHQSAVDEMGRGGAGAAGCVRYALQPNDRAFVSTVFAWSTQRAQIQASRSGLGHTGSSRTSRHIVHAGVGLLGGAALLAGTTLLAGVVLLVAAALLGGAALLAGTALPALSPASVGDDSLDASIAMTCTAVRRQLPQMQLP